MVYVGLIVSGSSMTVIDQSYARFIDLPDGVAYDNPAYGVFLKLPETWTFDELGYDNLATFSSGDFIWTGGLTVDVSGATPASLADDIVSEIGEAGPVESLSRSEEVRTSGPAISMALRAEINDSSIRYWATVYGKGAAVYTLYFVAPESLSAACESELQSFRQNFHFTDL